MATRVEDKLPTRWSLIRRLKDWEDQESWREFFEIYEGFITSVALRSGLSAVEAQEVVQETVLSVCKSIKSFEANPKRGSFKGWLMQITRWRIVDQTRKRAPNAPKLSAVKSSSEEPGEGTTATANRIPDPRADVLHEQWDAEWQRHLFEAALKRLEGQINAKHYQVFFLSYFRGVDTQKVARAVGISASQVYVINHRTIPQFRRILDHLGHRYS